MNRKQRRMENSQAPARGLSPVLLGLFAQAIGHHQQGRLAAAIEGYRQVIAAAPDCADAIYNLAVALASEDRPEEAAICYRRVTALAPGNADAHNNLGNLLRIRGELDQAAASFRRALALRPDHAEACSNLGNVLRQQDRAPEAIAAFRRAIALRPDFAEAYSNLGDALRAAGLAAEAEQSCRRAIALRPGLADSYNNLALVLLDRGRPAEAAAAAGQAIALHPASAPAQCNLGAALAASASLDAAAEAYGAAIALDPALAAAHAGLGDCRRRQDRPAEAAASYRQALACQPAMPGVANNLGLALEALGQLDAALQSFRASPEDPQSLTNQGNVLRRQGRLAAAVDCYRAALSVDAELAETHFQLGLALLAQGEMAEGWREYEWRWRTAQMRQAGRHFPQPQWHGEAAAGQVLLVHAEQGFGDTLQFCRLASLAAARGLIVVMEVPAPLVRLMRGLSGVTQVVAHGAALPDFDLHCPMLSLPLALGITLESIPAAVPYLHADAAAVEFWRRQLAGPAHRGLRVGLAWAGDPSQAATDARRSLPPERLAPLFGMPEVVMFNLQKFGPRPPATAPMADFMAGMTDFADSAALVANLDLVICVDTAMVHLAGALGRKVWMLDRFDPCWRWLTGRTDSPWYPGLRLYRQPRAEDWDNVLASVSRDLRAEVSARA